MSDLTGRCLCGACTWRSTGPVLWSAVCHCEDCRRAASSDFVSWFGVSNATVSWTGPRTFYKSSAKVRRSFCGQCGAPLSFESEVFPDETHLYACTLDEPARYRPSAHIFWSERVPWLEASDDLPKHAKGLQHAAENGEKLLG